MDELADVEIRHLRDDLDRCGPHAKEPSRIGVQVNGDGSYRHDHDHRHYRKQHHHEHGHDPCEPSDSHHPVNPAGDVRPAAVADHDSA